MSTFCGGSKSIPSFTILELKAEYPGGILQSIDTSSITESDNWIKTTVKKLESTSVIPKLKSTKSPDSTDSLDDYTKKDTVLQDSIKREYCFYEVRYFSALDSFLQGISDVSMKGKSTDINKKLDIAKELNSKLTILTQVVNGISKYRHSSSLNLKTDNVSINNSIQQRSKDIKEQSKILNSNTATIDMYNRMVEYTKEKNHANQNLISLYGILNIVAIGIVVYISRN